MANVFDLHHKVAVSAALNSQTIATDTDTNGTIIDTAGYHGLEFVLQSGAITDGTYTVKLQEGDAANLSDATDVSSENTLGSISFAATDDNTAKRIGYLGKKRYVRLVITSASTTSGGVFSGTALRFKPNHGPVAD